MGKNKDKGRDRARGAAASRSCTRCSCRRRSSSRTASGVHKDRLSSFELALRDAGIEKANLVTVSSIFPPHCKEMSRKEGEKLIMPGQIVHCVMARQDTNEPNRLIAAAIGLARPADKDRYGYLSEHHSYGETAKKVRRLRRGPRGDDARDHARHRVRPREAPGTSASRSSGWRRPSSRRATSCRAPRATPRASGPRSSPAASSSSRSNFRHPARLRREKKSQKGRSRGAVRDSQPPSLPSLPVNFSRSRIPASFNARNLRRAWRRSWPRRGRLRGGSRRCARPGAAGDCARPLARSAASSAARCDPGRFDLEERAARPQLLVVPELVRLEHGLEAAVVLSPEGFPFGPRAQHEEGAKRLLERGLVRPGKSAPMSTSRPAPAQNALQNFGSRAASVTNRPSFVA